MKRFVTALGIILAIALLNWWHTSHLSSFTNQLIGQLERLPSYLNEEDWNGARTVLEQAEQDWERQAFYLHTTLHHSDIDEIHSSFREITSYLEIEDDEAECLAVNAKLINQLELLIEAEQPSLKNIF